MPTESVLENVLGLSRSDLHGLSERQKAKLACEILESLSPSPAGTSMRKAHDRALASAEALHMILTS